MTYRIEITPTAQRQVRKLDPQARRRVQGAIELLADDPRPPAAKMLVNSGGAWRVRVGDYRIVYDIEDGRLLVLVLAAGHRQVRATCSMSSRNAALVSGDTVVRVPAIAAR